MRSCKNCGNYIPNRVMIEGKYRNIQSRKFCLECSPFGSHNTRPIIDNDKLPEPTCAKCGIEGKDNFYNRAARGENSFYSYCKKCYNKDSKERQKQKKIDAVESKGGCCQKCGYDKCISALEFHHVDPTEKDPTIRWGTASLKRIQEELTKCILVCANCHREIHANS